MRTSRQFGKYSAAALASITRRLDRIGGCEGGSQLVELAQIGTEPKENTALAVQLVGDQLARDREVQAVRNREGLRTSDRMAVAAERHAVREHLAIASDLH